MRFTTAIVAVSFAAAFTAPQASPRAPASIRVESQLRVALEDVNDRLIAENAPILLDYLSHPDELLRQPPSFSTLEPAAKLALLQQNYKALVASAVPSLENFVGNTAATLNLDAYGPWYVAVFCLFVAAAQRGAGREEARQELIDKIVSGELDVEEMVRKIKSEQAAAEREKMEREAELARLEQEALAVREAERQILLEERLAQEAAEAARKAAILRAAQERKEKQEALRREAQQLKETRRREAEEKRQAAETARQVRAEEKRIALETKRLQVEEKKRTASELRRVEAQQRLALVDAKRLEAELKKRAAEETKLVKRQEAEQKKRAAAEEARLLTLAHKKKAADDSTQKLGAVVEAEHLAGGAQKLSESKVSLSAAAADSKRAKEEARRDEEARLARKAAEELEAQRLEVEQKKREEERKIRQGPPASSLARILAREYGLDISTIRPTGRGGRVTADDVRNALPPDESTPIDRTVDFFFADPAEDIHEEEITERSTGLFSALRRKTEKQLRDYLSHRGVSIRDKNGEFLRKSELILEVLEQSYASRQERMLST